MVRSSNMNQPELETIVSLCKRRGFVYPGSEIYGGLAGTYDYGPLGVLLRENLKQAWRRSIKERSNIVELDSAIFMDPRVWEASGHVGGFSDPLVEHKPTSKRFRVDHLLEAIDIAADEKMTLEEIQKLFDENFEKLDLPKGSRTDFTDVKQFNLLVQSNLGDFSGSGEAPVYLRGETAQGIYVNYKNVLDTMPVKVPFGIAQIGKAFRNEIKPRQFVFRTREFTQMEMQYFVHPDQAEAEFEAFKQQRMNFYVEKLNINPDKLRFKDHENLVFYAQAATDIEYEFDFGWKEIEGIHWRGDYDLSQHQEFSGQKLNYTDPATGETFVPHVVETSVGLDRMMLAVIYDAYREDEIGGEKRTYLNFSASLAPIKVAVSPLLRNKPELYAKAQEVFLQLKEHIQDVAWDDNGNIGKRYRRQDEVGTPFCIVIDFETLEGGAVTIRDRNSAEQERVQISEIESWLKNKLS